MRGWGPQSACQCPHRGHATRVHPRGCGQTRCTLATAPSWGRTEATHQPQTMVAAMPFSRWIRDTECEGRGARARGRMGWARGRMGWEELGLVTQITFSSKTGAWPTLCTHRPQKGWWCGMGSAVLFPRAELCKAGGRSGRGYQWDETTNTIICGFAKFLRTTCGFFPSPYFHKNKQFSSFFEADTSYE
jgi:hypothetical protein